MRTVTIIPAAGMPVVIYDGRKTPLPDANADGFKPKFKRASQLQPGFRAPFQSLYPRFNHAAQWDFTVCHRFTSLQAAQDFVGQRNEVLPDSGELQILTQTSQGLFNRYLKLVIIGAPEVQNDNSQAIWIKYSLVWASPYSLTP